MQLSQTLLMAIFLIVAGITLCDVALPRTIRIIGGLCAIVVGVLMLIGVI